MPKKQLEIEVFETTPAVKVQPELRRIPMRLDKNYITKPLDSKSFSILALDQNYRVAEKIYCIANDIKETHHFLEIVGGDDLRVQASVRCYPAFAGEARSQASSVGFIRSKFRSTPHYIVRCKLYMARTWTDIFSIEHKTSDPDKVYELCLDIEKHIRETYL